MNYDAFQKVFNTLNNDDLLRAFASLNGLALEAARALLERLLEEPELEEEVKQYIFSPERSEDFRGYTAGESTGYRRGHQSGFFKGTLAGVIGTVTTVVAVGFAIAGKLRG